ncbi:MAG: hypothetical protein GWP91_11740 [Rhodobacterales bacterium]|nr:hypothetical protein [Rhodobacterales bacterium]
MNIYLIPHNFTRHVVLALYLGGAAAVSWWAVLAFFVLSGPTAWRWGYYWPQWFEGFAFVAVLTCTVAFMTVFAEGALRRRKMQYRIGYSTFSAGLAFFMLGFGLTIYGWVKPLLASEAMRPILEDASLVTLRYRLVPWLFMGLAAGTGPWMARSLQRVVARRFGWGVDGAAATVAPSWTGIALDFFHHLGGAVASSLMGAAVWHMLGYYLLGDLYLASALSAFTFGSCYGLLVWGVPADLYAGWLRVLSAERFGLRIPIPSVEGTAAERFVGHFPRGLDLYLPADQGVAELHLSVVVDAEHRYAVRGLSVESTVVKRPLERIELRYDPSRPAPLETELSMEDRVLLGENGDTVVEFILLPKEER